MQYRTYRVKMFRPVIAPKWYGAIWALLIFASMLRNIYTVASTVQAVIGDGVSTVIINLIVEIIFSGVIPAALCYLCALIMVGISSRRGLVYCNRNDFIYFTMLFTAGARIVIGLVESAAILYPVVLSYTSFMIEETVLTAALFAMFFGVLKPKFMNDWMAYRVFSLYAVIYFFFQGLNTVIPCTVYLLMGSGTPVGEEFLAVLQSLTETPITIDVHVKAGCILGLCIFAAWIIATVVLSVVMHSKAAKCAPPEENDDRPDGGSPFEEFPSAQDKPSDKVFDEFDL